MFFTLRAVAQFTTIKALSRLLLVSHLTSATAIAQQETISQQDLPKSDIPTAVFTEVEYKLAWVDQGDGSRSQANEYLPEGETLENWTAMIAVRQWPHLKQLRELTKTYVDQIKHLLVQDVQVYAPDTDRESTTLVIECYLAPADRSYLEYNLIRFCTEPGEPGVKSYQFALRGDYNLAVAKNLNQERLAERLNALSKLKLKVHVKMPKGK